MSLKVPQSTSQAETVFLPRAKGLALMQQLRQIDELMIRSVRLGRVENKETVLAPMLSTANADFLGKQRWDFASQIVR